ncbi:MAG: trypsin-like peptidase domain-containing protein [Planctomycetes bacterium]|nr:trypsin-like peptidase domain-containing protein [Planctomycetota bacterium]
MKTDDAFHGITTLITANLQQGQCQGSGFFYQQMAPAPGEARPGWREVQKTWLVTNRHVVFPKIGSQEMVPDTLAFHMRKIDGQVLRWDPVVLSRADLLARARVHSNPLVDVCVVDVLDLLKDRVSSGTYAQWYPVHAEQHAGKNNISVEVADDAIVIGYPRGYYDDVNLFPIVKSGIIATRWGLPFKGLPCFLVDAKLFPGSSGSIVVSKPRDIVVVDGNVMLARDKQFAFLGVFSGEPYKQEHPLDFDDMTIVRKSSFNLGIVWYGVLVDQIISQDCRHPEAPANTTQQPTGAPSGAGG